MYFQKMMFPLFKIDNTYLLLLVIWVVIQIVGIVIIKFHTRSFFLKSTSIPFQILDYVKSLCTLKQSKFNIFLGYTKRNLVFICVSLKIFDEQ